MFFALRVNVYGYVFCSLFSTSDKITSTANMTNSITSTSTSTSSTIDKLKAIKDSFTRKETRKVDFYLKNYGFVPKNVMTEAEWAKARRDAPKVKPATGLKATAYQGHYW
ncbi:hypothetical protein TESG_01862 [Trichophyton tonsurans CBS 112818]|uniref:Uncharacterized protein n=2 Tax=Trichophyton TaxID=5550 RepID=F2PLG0_TRIEC|nr:hypothetical protein TESG_01862 [Trichophyton tonsurans CBS 112818]EGE02525.1 hypothetical protein TEQG_01559 [Trichophyton equinum CBS 127.97]